ncbi:MAG TPA: carboxypeptidase regulatory-like domain-containing protein [Phycisphaerae bacterium]|jgi:plastocyanin
MIARIAVALAVCGALGGSVRAADSGTISGKVTLKGGKDAAAPRKDLREQMKGKDPVCSNQHPNPVGSELEVVGPAGEIRYVLVSIKNGLGDRKFATPTEAVELDQKGCMYRPHVFGMMVGQTLKIQNADGTSHNVNAKPEKNEGFNTPQPAAGEPITKTFKRPEIFPIKCDVHPWMSAWCGVFEHPFFAVTDKDGGFTIRDVPPGEYTLQFWHEVYPPKELKVTVKAGEPAKADVEMVSK